jgi:hypothetical protein
MLAVRLLAALAEQKLRAPESEKEEDSSIAPVSVAPDGLVYLAELSQVRTFLCES